MEQNKKQFLVRNKKQIISVFLALSSFVIIVLGVAWIGYSAFGDEPQEIRGQVEARQYKVSAKVSARIKKVLVKEGQYVQAGDTLVILDAPEIDAQHNAAIATAQAAEAMSEMTDNGERQEKIQGADDLVKQAKAARDIAKKTYDRMQRLYDEGVTTEQKRDEALAAYQASDAQLGAAQSQYEMLQNGARKEQRRAAAEQAKAARSGTEVVSSLLKETVQIATLDGEVEEIYAHEGEYVSSGTPIMSINLLDDIWGKFSIREDLLNGIHVGSTISAYSPAFNKYYKLQVYYMEAAEDCSTWKATKATGDYDKRTFEIRARPVRNYDCPYSWKKDKTVLRPGMLLVLK